MALLTRPIHPLPIIALACAVLLPGCGEDEGTGASPTRTVRALSAWDEVSPLLGFAISDALPDELYVSTLTWNQRAPDVKFSPFGTQTLLRWCLAVPDPRSGLTRFEEVDVRCDPKRMTTDTTACDDRLEATLVLRMRSDDGALDEDLPVTFSAANVRAASFSAPDLTSTSFGGTFVISNTDGAGNTLDFGVFGNIEPRAASGSFLAARAADTDAAQTEGEPVYTVAHWTADRTPAAGERPPCAEF